MKIKDIESFNAGIMEAVRLLRQHFFAGNLEGGNDAILQLEGRLIPVPDNGDFTAIIPDSVPEEFVEAKDLTAE